MPRSSRRLLDPQDHGALEHITLHPQLRILPLQLTQTGSFIDVQAVLLAALDPLPIHPVAQGPRIDPEVPGHLSDRLAGLTHDPHRALTELGVVLPTCLWHHHSSYAMPPRFCGIPAVPSSPSPASRTSLWSRRRPLLAVAALSGLAACGTGPSTASRGTTTTIDTPVNPPAATALPAATTSVAPPRPAATTVPTIA